jgi:hypothetical protein
MKLMEYQESSVIVVEASGLIVLQLKLMNLRKTIIKCWVS